MYIENMKYQKNCEVTSREGVCFNFRFCSNVLGVFCIQYRSKVSYHLLSRFSRDRSLFSHETRVLPCETRFSSWERVPSCKNHWSGYFGINCKLLANLTSQKWNESDAKLAFGGHSNCLIALCWLCINFKLKLALQDPILWSQMKKLNRAIFF